MLRFIRNTNKNLGFTLIELLVVISIIGLTISIGLVNFKSGGSHARDAKRIADLYQIKSALEIYYDEHHAYPSIGYDFQLPWSSADDGAWAEFQNLIGEDLSKLPTPPSTPDSTYEYYFISAPPETWSRVRIGLEPPRYIFLHDGYYLFTALENITPDGPAATDGGTSPYLYEILQGYYDAVPPIGEEY